MRPRTRIWPFVDSGIVAIAHGEARARFRLDALHALAGGVERVREWMVTEDFSPMQGCVLVLPASWRGEISESVKPPYVFFDRKHAHPTLYKPDVGR